LSSNPNLAAAAADRIDDILIQPREVDSAYLIVLKPVEAARKRREPGPPFLVVVNRPIAF
jgi:hypothetical protein